MPVWWSVSSFIFRSGIWTWVEKHMKDVERSRQTYDGRKASAPSVDDDA